jgi:hypothetical protein
MKKTVYIIRPYFNPDVKNGALERYGELATNLTNLNCNVTLFCSTFLHNSKDFIDKKSSSLINSNYQIEFINSGSYINNISIRRVIYEINFGINALLSISKKRRPDIILIGEPLFLVGFIFGIYCKLKKISICGDFIDLSPEAYYVKEVPKFPINIIFNLLIKLRKLRALYFYDKLFFCSKSYINNIIEKVEPLDKFAVFYWCSKMKPRLLVNKNFENSINIVYAGSLGEGYDIEILIELAQYFNDDPLNIFNFFIAGDGPKKKMCEDAHRNKHIIFLGKLSKSELDVLYSTAHIGILPYKKKSAVSMPIKFYDYLNYNLFIISSIEMEVKDILASKPSLGISYKAGDFNDLKKAIIDSTVYLKARFSSADNSVSSNRDSVMPFDYLDEYKKFAQSILNMISK